MGAEKCAKCAKCVFDETSILTSDALVVWKCAKCGAVCFSCEVWAVVWASGGVKVCIGVIQAEKCGQSVGVVAGVASVGWCGRAGECGRTCSVVECGGVDGVSSVKCESAGVKVSVGMMV